MSSLWDILLFLYSTISKQKFNIVKNEHFLFQNFSAVDCSKSVFWLSTIVFHWLNSLLQKGSRNVQLLFSWYLFFGFKVNKFSKAFGEALFLHLNIGHEILKMFISYIFKATFTLKRGLECVNWSLKLRNLIECFCWR